MDEMESSANPGRNTVGVKIRYDGTIFSGKSASDEILLSGLSDNKAEAARLAAVFWEMVWPKLEESGWEKVS